MIYGKLADLPYGVGGFTVHDENGDYTIFLNSRDSYERNQEVLQHEMDHIKNRDFESDMLATDIEKARHE